MQSKIPGFRTVTADTLVKGGQSWIYSLATMHVASGTLLRVTVKHDFYEEQSFGLVESFDTIHRRWNPIHRLPGSLLETRAMIAVNKTMGGSDYALFHMDVATLLDQVDALLSAAMPVAAQ